MIRSADVGWRTRLQFIQRVDPAGCSYHGLVMRISEILHKPLHTKSDSVAIYCVHWQGHDDIILSTEYVHSQLESLPSHRNSRRPCRMLSSVQAKQNPAIVSNVSSPSHSKRPFDTTNSVEEVRMHSKIFRPLVDHPQSHFRKCISPQTYRGWIV